MADLCDHLPSPAQLAGWRALLREAVSLSEQSSETLVKAMEVTVEMASIVTLHVLAGSRTGSRAVWTTESKSVMARELADNMRRERSFLSDLYFGKDAVRRFPAHLDHWPRTMAVAPNRSMVARWSRLLGTRRGYVRIIAQQSGSNPNNAARGPSTGLRDAVVGHVEQFFATHCSLPYAARRAPVLPRFPSDPSERVRLWCHMFSIQGQPQPQAQHSVDSDNH